MFERASRKLEDARTALHALRSATDAAQFRSAFAAFLSHSRAVTYALQKEGAHLPGFGDWYRKRQAEIKADELMRFFHEARTDDFHEGKDRLSFSTHIQHFSPNAAGPPPEPGAAIVIGPEGPFWLVGQGTARERRIPIKKGGRFSTAASIAGAPASHRGKPLTQSDPVTLCTLGEQYLAELLHEARTTLGAARA